MKSYQALFIDWDDTIGDWSSSAIAAQQDIFAKYNLREFYNSFAEYFEVYHTHNAELWERYGRSEITKDELHLERFLFPLVHALGGGEMLMRSPRFLQLAHAMGEDFLKWTNKYFTLVPGVKELVEQLATHYPLTIVSNGFASVQYYKIDHSGLKDCFQHIVLSEEVGVQKPNPRIFDEAIRMNNLEREKQGLCPLTQSDILMIGDGYGSDIQGAIHAGIDQAWICPDDNALQDDTRPATYKIRSFAEVLPLLGL